MEDNRDAIIYNIDKYRNIRNQARYYFNITKCNYLELSRQARVTPERAQMWILKFIKERKVKNG